MEQTQTLKTLAESYRKYFTQSKRIEGKKFWRTIDGAPPELMLLVQTAHADMLPDDWRYRFIVEALDVIAEDGEDATAEPDIYTAKLTAWLASNVSRVGYCDEVEYSYKQQLPFFELLQLGQQLERQEVLDSVMASLQSILADG
jgi:hypothetical protein